VRITVVDAEGSLVPLAAMGNSAREAVRTGVIYSADGRTRFGLPAGSYRVFASHGWEYSAPSQAVSLKAGGTTRLVLTPRREATIAGYQSCDTHVHTLELSGHGDATVREQLITAAGEGLDCIVATEHDRVVDYSAVLRELGLQDRLAVVPGVEVTTALGHFNVFPLASDARPPDSRLRDWAALSEGIRQAGAAGVMIQNHPRDLHAGYRPFDPAHHFSPAGENLQQRPFFANAVEVINSGAMYSDVLQPVRDWLGLLNRGYQVAAIGGSDTHAVDFAPAGQARTYYQSGRLVASLRDGVNLVSYGLAADLRLVEVDGKPRSKSRYMGHPGARPTV
jgi:predicted metal-dependent phosphoesterase TrpH